MSTYRLSFIFVIALAVTNSPIVRAQEAPQSPDVESRATFTSGIDFVLVDVIVSDDNGPVMDLTAEDFEIIEDGEIQVIEEFRLVRVNGTAQFEVEPPLPIRSVADERREARRDDIRLFVFFLDDYHTQFGNAVIARDALIDFVRTSVGPNDLMAVMGPLTPLEEVRLTRDHEFVIRQISRFEGRRFRYNPMNRFEESYAQYSSDTIETIRNQVVISALRGLAMHLGAMREGRKSIVYVSEGMTATVPSGVRNDIAATGMGRTNMNPSMQVFQQGDLLNRLRDVYNDANRNNTAIYTLDPRGLGAGGFLIDQNVSPGEAQAYLNEARTVLRVLAEQTDGVAIVNRNDLVRGLMQVLRDSSTYYLIGYGSQAKSDGEFHEIEVRVGRRGVNVRARPGYWAATEADVIRAATPAAGIPEAVEDALESIAGSRRAEQYVRLWLGSKRGQNGKTEVSLVWEPLSPLPGIERGRAGQLMVLVISPEGDLLYRGRTPEQTMVGGGPYQVVFETNPGWIELDISIEAESGGRIDNEIRELEIPDFSVGQIAISEPRVYRTRNAREFRELIADGDAVPTPSREFRRSERLLIRFDVYGEEGVPAVAEAALLNRSGNRMVSLVVDPAVAGGTHQIELGLGTMPPGEYLVEITISGSEIPVLVPLRISG
jgi:VWFA-related protein